MGFTNQERINFFTKALAAGVVDANSVAVWYETFFPFSFILDAEQVWTQLGTVRQYPAANLAAAQANAAGPLAGIVEDRSAAASAVRLTLVAGTNNSTYAAYSTYNDPSSALLRNWLLPQLIPQASGAPSNGYSIALYNGNPNAGGVLISTSAGTTGTGVNKSVGWIFNYANGLLFLSDDFKSSITDPYIVGFRYIGTTAGSGSTVSFKREVIDAGSFVFNSPVSEYTLAAVPDTAAGVLDARDLWRNGVLSPNMVSGVPAAPGEWRITGSTLQIFGDVQGSGDEYVVRYPHI